MKIATTLFLFVVVGFSVGDELGFTESLSNLESSKRRSVQAGRGNAIPVGSGNVANRRQVSQNTRTVPPFKPLPPGAARPMAQQPERQRLVVQQNSTALRMVPAPSFAVMQEEAMRQQQRMQQEEKNRQQQRMQQEALALQVLKQQQAQQQEAMRQQQMQKLTQQQNVQDQLVAMQTRRIQLAQSMATAGAAGTPLRMPHIVTAIPPAGSVLNPDIAQSLPKPMVGVIAPGSGLPPFIAMPKSSAQLTDRISNSPVLLEESVNEVEKNEFSQLPIPDDEAISAVNQLTLRSIQPAAAAQALQSVQQQQNEKQQSSNQASLSLASIQSMEPSLKALAEASNITLEALETAILLRQQQLMQKHQERTTTSTTTSTTTQSPVKNRYNYAAPTKVMNAPREYYPMGYDKNFDDNFASRVDLPDTSFYCGDQKHFPGLYADEDLGCMVFHVCALTDDGLIMKSFLCPESTLFDQTILKCNWWFYVDCKASKNLYDSNIPISKSYQLMKALAFFSGYKSHDNSTESAVDNEGS
ncbi:mediator of RNA polymerase II transcription subunit 15 isoform X2 [Cephus cinctus]|uniref:Mediator of RNA polymerase II transcription subunit 15 isoform X2 n=1 Tax=Cephus cinctus TaxID=211228 RepID=A0AAJ7BH23_CEPCN|nr:mediator of RNA polymerase II transcription subunit 15 isoform X2 [Cephus cinctus]